MMLATRPGGRSELLRSSEWLPAALMVVVVASVADVDTLRHAAKGLARIAVAAPVVVAAGVTIGVPRMANLGILDMHTARDPALWRAFAVEKIMPSAAVAMAVVLESVKELVSLGKLSVLSIGLL